MTEHTQPDGPAPSGISPVMSRRGLLTAGAAVATAVAVGAVPTTAAAAPNTNGVIYGVEADKDVLWYRHEGRSNGTPRWANNGRGRKVGSGWDFAHVFAGGAGVVYGVQGNGDLFWYRHEGRNNGTPRWANNGTGRRIGNGWNFEHVLYGN